nr:MAG TPA: hypothetical protein [Caudoviricetes sp.]
MALRVTYHLHSIVVILLLHYSAHNGITVILN